jgi:hypothetical protein
MLPFCRRFMVSYVVLVRKREHGGWHFTTNPPTLRGAVELALSTYALS